MMKVSELVQTAAAEVGCKAVKVDQRVMEALRLLVWQRFTDAWSIPPMWEHLKDDSFICASDAWSWVGEYVGSNDVIMFFDVDDDKSAVVFEDGSSVVAALANSSGFVFYLTDLDASYVLCFNDHDFLIGAGAAVDWIKRKKESEAP